MLFNFILLVANLLCTFVNVAMGKAGFAAFSGFATGCMFAVILGGAS